MIIVCGTGNKDKIKEIKRTLLPLLPTVELSPVTDFAPDFDPVEDAETLAGNALIKARVAAKVSSHWAIADDTGLFIDALGGAPGVRSARYSGPTATYAANRAKALDAMRAVPAPDRTAQFRTVIALVCDRGEFLYEGAVKGRILDRETGDNGFGYDSLFYCDELGKTFGEAGDDEKNAVSHRGRALAALANGLKTLAAEYGATQ